jgi:hypothetical protein
MERTEAFKTLRLDQSADGRMVENAYWTLVRQAQRRAEQEPGASHDIDKLNEAYDMLSPEKHAPRATRPRARTDASGVPVVDALADWLAEEALRTRERWHGRNPEIAAIGGAALMLMTMAFASGASAIAVTIATLVIFIAIWAPWRRTHTPPPDSKP